MKKCQLERVTCFMEEDETVLGTPLYKAVLQCAKRHAGVTALAHKSFEGTLDHSQQTNFGPFGRSRKPVSVSAMGTPESIQPYLSELMQLAEDRLVTYETVEKICPQGGTL